MIAAGLIRLVHVIVCRSSERAGRDILPPRLVIYADSMLNMLQLL